MRLLKWINTHMRSAAGVEPSLKGMGPGEFPCHWYRSCAAEIASGSSRQIPLPMSSYTSFTLEDIVSMRDSNVDDAKMNNTLAWKGVQRDQRHSTAQQRFRPRHGVSRCTVASEGRVTVSTTQRVTKNKAGLPNGAWLLRLADLGCTEVAKLGLGMH